MGGPFIIRKKFYEPARNPFLLLLDSIQDPRNLGAILRSAYCTGVDGIIICGKNSAPLNATALKSSAGLAEHLDIYQAPTALAAVQDLKKAGYPLYLATLQGEDATGFPYSLPLCLVIGNESTGIEKISSRSVSKSGFPKGRPISPIMHRLQPESYSFLLRIKLKKYMIVVHPLHRHVNLSVQYHHPSA